MINNRGYANVVQVDNNTERQTESVTKSTTESETESVAYGLVYQLSSSDEKRLDINEGVPFAYTKEHLSTEFWPARQDNEMIDISDDPQLLKMLVYIDRDRTKDEAPKQEYIYRMNMGINDAVGLGLPQEYVKRVMRPFIPEKAEQDVKALAEKQALAFEDEA